MTAVATAPRETAAPTIWGCTPQQIHDRFWAAFGVQVVRKRERSEIVEGAELFLLCEAGTLVLFRLAQVIETLYWIDPSLLVLRIRADRPSGYQERIVTQDDRLVRFERAYHDGRGRSVRVALTPDREVAKLWQHAPADESPWRWLRSHIARDRRVSRVIAARVFDSTDDAQTMECVQGMMRAWARPDTTIRRALRPRNGVWADTAARIDEKASFVAPVWIGAGRRVEAGAHVVGPAVLWDAPDARPIADEVRFFDIEPASLTPGAPRRIMRRTVPGKRAFDVLFALAALALTLPLYPFVALAILIEDGRPIFFAHRRETLGGREYPCLKFRSMSKSAGVSKTQLKGSNQADGPQFFIKDDPRVTRVGRFLRKSQIDELPQFLNVLVGHMSIVGPRPSPHDENQFCPAWREARLSVRPGVTGLWQVSRTRQQGLDFQEWIRFDLDYVERASWWLDFKIIAQTIGVVVKGLL